MARKPYDDYKTPEWCAETLLKAHPFMGPNILEPCAGSGSIIKVLKKHRPAAWVDAVEIRPEERENLKQVADNVITGDFLKWQPSQTYQTIITNPPYSLAQEIIEHALRIAQGRAEVIMLLRLAFLESQKRYDFWQKHPVSALYVLSERPSFTGGGTDATAYAWFVWGKSVTQRVKVLSRKEAS